MSIEMIVLSCILIAAFLLLGWPREGDDAAPAEQPKPPTDWRRYFERVLIVYGMPQVIDAWSQALVRHPFEHETINMAFYATYADYDRPRWPRRT